MAQFRKKPVVIEAEQLLPNNESILKVETLIEGHPLSLASWISQEKFDDYCNARIKEGGRTIKTLEGDMWASFGDWIIKGVKSEIYPCKPDIFEATYEVV